MKGGGSFNRIKKNALLASAAACFLWLALMPDFRDDEAFGTMRVGVTLNGVQVGTLGSREEALRCLREARRSFAGERLSSSRGSIALSDAELVATNLTNAADTGQITLDSEEEVTQAMLEVLRQNIHATLEKHYSVKIGDYCVNLKDAGEVLKLLDTALSVYDDEDKFAAELILDPEREVNVLTARVTEREGVDGDDKADSVFLSAGSWRVLGEEPEAAMRSPEEMDFSEFDLGLRDMDFADKIEVVEAYLPDDELTDLQTAIDDVTKDKETPQVYEVKSGDTLSVIAEKYNLTLADLIAMNETLEDAASTIRPEDELIVTVPEPELSVRYETEEYLEESYEAEVQIIPNDSWYTNKSVTLQEPSSGFRKVIAKSVFMNRTEVERDIVKEVVTWEAVPKIVEKGTIVPPSYIKPISGGRMTSGFGKRSRPTRGASTYHKGIDWATPVGTAVVASSAGVVTKAGWGSGYGYVVYISHPDGKSTRYGHLSKILVKTGQTVSQGQKIALSGNTGVSTGPHIHFEILVNGAQVNPLKYLN